MKASDVKTNTCPSSDDCAYKTQYLLGPGLHASATDIKACEYHMSRRICSFIFYWFGEAVVYFVTGCVISFKHASCNYRRHSSSLSFGLSSRHTLNNSTIHSSYYYSVKYACQYSSHISTHSYMYSSRYSAIKTQYINFVYTINENMGPGL